MKKRSLFILVMLALSCTFTSMYIIMRDNNQVNQVKKPVTSKNILLVHITNGFGGAEVHKIALYKLLRERGYNANILVSKNSIMHHELEKLQLPCLTTNIGMLLHVSIAMRWALYYRLYALCQEKSYTIIQCYTEKEVWAAQRVAQTLPIKTIFERHISQPIRHLETLQCDGIIGVSKPIVLGLEEQARHVSHHGSIELIRPFFNEDKFLQFVPTESREQFFKNNFNLILKDLPVITMIAQMNKDVTHKNHPLLIQAIHTLVYEKKKPVEVLLVGDGASIFHIKKLVVDVKLQDYVHFLGFTHQTPALLFYSDMHVLTSSKEAFGLVHLEASLMKKPVIGATDTGAVDLIEHGYNGLLFENNNCDSLVTQIKTVLDNPILRREMGEHAYTHAIKFFSNEIKLKQLERLYQKILDIEV